MFSGNRGLQGLMWAGQRERRDCPVSGFQLPSPGASGPLPRQDPWTPVRLIPGGQVQLGLPEKGLEVGTELRPPGYLC